MKEILEKRQLELKDEHDKVFDQIQQLQNQLNELSVRRVQLEGAFVEVTNLLKAAEEESKNKKVASKNMDDGAIK